MDVAKHTKKISINHINNKQWSMRRWSNVKRYSIQKRFEHDDQIADCAVAYLNYSPLKMAKKKTKRGKRKKTKGQRFDSFMLEKYRDILQTTISSLNRKTHSFWDEDCENKIDKKKRVSVALLEEEELFKLFAKAFEEETMLEPERSLFEKSLKKITEGQKNNRFGFFGWHTGFYIDRAAVKGIKMVKIVF